MTIKSNNEAAIAFGKAAVSAWKTGDEEIGSGDANAILAVYRGLPTVVLTAPIVRKKGEAPEQHDFDLTDWGQPVLNADGKTKDLKAMEARTIRVAEYLFGITGKLSNAAKQRLDRARYSAGVLYAANKHLSDEDYCDAVTLEKSDGKMCLHVPKHVMVDAPKEDAGKAQIKEYQATKDLPIALTGTKGLSLAELNKKGKPAPKKKGTDGKPSEGTSLLEVVKMARAGMAQLLKANPEEGSDTAPTTPLRLELAALQLEIVNYINAEKKADAEDDISAKINASKPARKVAGK